MNPPTIALPVLLSLAACGGGADIGGAGAPASGVVYVNLVVSTTTGTDGSYGRIGVDGYVSIRVGAVCQSALVAHELGHAMGLGHDFDPSCLMHSQHCDISFCPDEIAAALASPFPLTIKPEPALLDAITEAAAAWNAALHRTQFVVSP